VSIALVIFAATLVASLAGLYAAPQVIERSLFRPYWFLRRRQYETIVTSGFVHADLPHLIFNMLTFYFFAFPLERHIGSARFAALYLIGLVVSDLGTWHKHRNDPQYASPAHRARSPRCCLRRSSTSRGRRCSSFRSPADPGAALRSRLRGLLLVFGASPERPHQP
jgi:hypothetical protein